MDPPPLSLADVAHDSDFPIDPVLDPDNQDLFLPEEPADPSKRHDTLDAANGINHDDHLEAGLDDAAVSAIKASLSQAQAQADLHHANGSNTVATAYGAGTEENPIENPTIHMAPYSRPERGEGTPHPEYMVFPMREMFLDWLKGESSWCHFVQRRTTTPAKRAEERMKARLKAHEKMLMEMTPDEAANVPPLKRRKRMRTSPVLEKITYTCHHAGSYTSKHSADLPQAKLRLKTKASVKCNCPARIVLTELEGGVCRIVYYWKHDGHDPFSEGELDTGRLPKVVDDWLIEQINAGKDTDEIRRMLSISEEAKQEYVRKALEDPSSVDPTMPPPIAFQMKIKYPDIYNRFRKLRGPIRLIKIPKCRQDQFLNVPSPTTGQSTEETANRVHSLKATANDEADEPPLDSPDNLDVAGVGVDGMDILPSTDAGVDHQFDTDIQVNDLDPHPHAVLARFAEQQGHSDLAQALLSLPRDPVPGEETEKFEESVAKAAKAAAEVAEQEEDEKSDGWGDINPL